MDGHDRFVGVNAIRVGPDGALWVVDRGSPGIGKPAVPGGVKLVKIDVAANRVERVFDLAAVSRPWSFIDDVRFNGANAYLTDAGAPGLVVLDLASGRGRRVLEGHPSTVAQSPLVAEGKPLRTEKGEPVNIHADQLEVSPDRTGRGSTTSPAAASCRASRRATSTIPSSARRTSPVASNASPTRRRRAAPRSTSAARST